MKEVMILYLEVDNIFKSLEIAKKTPIKNCKQCGETFKSRGKICAYCYAAKETKIDPRKI